MNTKVADGFTDFTNDTDDPIFVKRDSKFSVESIAQSVRNFATLSEALRILGAVVLVTSMSVFLMQGWNEGNDINRYLLLLAQTGLLAAAGFAMSHGLRETKGARMFFGVALISVPANFTILSAMLYSLFQWDNGLTNYPDYAHWQIESLAGTGLTFAGALLVLIPVTLLCFKIMARHSSKALSLHFLLLNTLLLLPVRNSMAAGSIALLGVLYALFVIGEMSGKDRALKTGEGKFALATLFIPIGIILFRSMYFYQIDSLMLAMVSLALFMSARQITMFPDRSPKVALALESLSVPIGLVAALSFTDALGPMVSNALSGPVFAGLYSLLALDLLRRTNSQRLRKFVAVSISTIAGLSFTFSVAGYPGALTGILALIAGALLLLIGMSVRSRTATLSGVVTLVAALVFGFEAVWQLVLTSSWIDLAIFGASAIALGSVIDRHGVVIKLRLLKWFDSVGKRRAQIALED